MAERQIVNRVIWKQDQASAQQTIAQNNAVAASYSLSADAIAQLNQQAALFQARSAGFLDPAVVAAKDYRAALSDLTTQLNQVQAAEAGVARQAQVTADVLERQQKASVIRPLSGFPGGAVPEPPLSAFGAPEGGSAGGRFLSQAGRAAIALPLVGYQSPLSIIPRGLGALAEKTGASLTEMGVALGIAGAAVTALIVVLNHFQEEVKAAKNLLSGALSAQQNYYDALQNSTTEQVNAQIDQLRQARPALEQQVAETRAAVESAFAQEAQGFLGDASARVKDALGISPYQQLTEALDQQEQALQENIQTEARLTQGREAGAFTANDAAAAEEELAKARQQYLKELTGQIDQEAQSRLQLADLRRSGTQDQYNEFVQRNADEINLLRNYWIPQYELAGAATGELTDRLGDLEYANKLAAESVLPYIQAREREAQITEALTDRSDAVNDALKEMRDLQSDLAKASEASAKSLTALTTAENEHKLAVDRIETETGDKVTDIRSKLGDKLVDIDAKSAERIRQSKENDNISIEAAIARGDIAQAQQVLAQQKVRAEQERRNVEQQKEEAKANAKDQIDAATAQAKKLIDAEAERYRKEYQQRQQAHNEALQQERALINAENALRQSQALTVSYWNGVVANSIGDLSNSAYDATLRMAQAQQLLNGTSGGSYHPTAAVTPGGQNAVEAALASFYASHGGQYVIPQPGANYINPNLFDTPSYNTRPGIYRSNVPEFHIPMADFNRMNVGSMGGVQATIYIDGAGMDSEELSRTLVDKMKQLDERAKVDVVQRMTAVHKNRQR